MKVLATVFAVSFVYLAFIVVFITGVVWVGVHVWLPIIAGALAQ